MSFDPVEEGDAFTAAKLNALVGDAAAEVNDLEPADIEREALRWRHIPKLEDRTDLLPTFRVAALLRGSAAAREYSNTGDGDSSFGGPATTFTPQNLDATANGVPETVWGVIPNQVAQGALAFSDPATEGWRMLSDNNTLTGFTPARIALNRVVANTTGFATENLTGLEVSAYVDFEDSQTSSESNFRVQSDSTHNGTPASVGVPIAAGYPDTLMDIATIPGASPVGSPPNTAKDQNSNDVGIHGQFMICVGWEDGAGNFGVFERSIRYNVSAGPWGGPAAYGSVSTFFTIEQSDIDDQSMTGGLAGLWLGVMSMRHNAARTTSLQTSPWGKNHGSFRPAVSSYSLTVEPYRSGDLSA